MKGNNGDLLFLSGRSLTVSQLEQELSKITLQEGIKLSEQQVSDIFESRNDTLVSNHLIDFSLSNTVHLSAMLLERETFDANHLVKTLKDVSEIFYYVRASENAAYSDEDIIDQIKLVLNHYDGNMENTSGYFENHPLLSEEGPQWDII